MNDYGDEKPYFCRICGLPILSSPSYSCSHGCNFFLHKPCAQLPPKLNHHTHPPVLYAAHTLYLIPNFSSHSSAYVCELCEFTLHPLVAVAVDIRTKHKSHQPHPLVAVCRLVSSRCDACGEEHKGFFFSCRHCNYWIHQDCTMLPTVVKSPSHPHPFILAYSLPSYQLITAGNCAICSTPKHLGCNGVYLCAQLNSFAHLTCGANIKSETGLELEQIQLPDDEWDAFPSLVIRSYLESINPIPDVGDNTRFIIDKYHNHDLEFSRRRKMHNSVCDLCVQPINTASSSFHRCIQSSCNFLVHNICRNLPSSLNFSVPGDRTASGKVSVCPDPSQWFFNSTFFCFFCRRPCNGYCFYFPESGYHGLPFFIDLECMAAPNTIKHDSHRHCVLFRTTRLSWSLKFSCCADESIVYDIYKCVLCDWCIHIKCALLPHRTRHEFDKHPLQLFTGSDRQDCICDFCEEDIDPQYWLYGCRKCDLSFHVNCVPSVGHLSKVKFGGTITVPYHVHPIALTRMLTVGRHEMCRFCNQIIKGLVDEMAFRCRHCDFWIHFSCARDAAFTPAQASTPMLYWETQEERLRQQLQIMFSS